MIPMAKFHSKEKISKLESDFPPYKCPTCGKGRLFDANHKMMDAFDAWPSKEADQPYFKVKCPRCGRTISVAINTKTKTA